MFVCTMCSCSFRVEVVVFSVAQGFFFFFASSEEKLRTGLGESEKSCPAPCFLHFFSTRRNFFKPCVKREQVAKKYKRASPTHTHMHKHKKPTTLRKEEEETLYVRLISHALPVPLFLSISCTLAKVRVYVKKKKMK